MAVVRDEEAQISMAGSISLPPMEAPGGRVTVDAEKSLHLQRKATKKFLEEAEAKLAIASMYVHDAIHGRNNDHLVDAVARRINRWLRHPAYVTLYVLTLVVDLALATIELPSTYRPVSPEGSDGVNQPKLPMGSVLAIEVACLVVFVIDIVLRYRLMGRDRFSRYPWAWVKVGFVGLAVCNVVAFLIDDRVLRVHRLFRPLMLIAHFRNVQKIFGNMAATVTRIGQVTVLLCFHVMFFGVMANKLFGGITGPTVPGSTDHLCLPPKTTNVICSPFAKDCLDYFGHSAGSMNQLFILLTTANFPDVMMPAYDCQPWLAAPFFVVFLMVGLFFIMNLILAAAYAVFQDKTREKTLQTIRKRVRALDAAFEVLTEHKVWSGGLPGITFGDFSSIITRVRSDLTPFDVEVMYGALDVGEAKLLTKREWRELVHIVEVKIREKATLQNLRFHTMSGIRKRFGALVSSKWFNRGFDGLVYLNTFLVVIQSLFFTNSVEYNNLDLALTVLLYVFVVELSLKIFGLGAARFAADTFNVLDFVIVFGALLVQVVVPDPDDGGSGDQEENALGFVSFLRGLRLLRALRALKGFGEIVRTFTSIVPTFMRYMAVFITVFYSFSIVGMECFAGTIVEAELKADPVLWAHFNTTSYSNSGYWNNNFDSFFRAMVTLFELTIVNNWPVIMEGFVAATQTRWTMLFFYVWFFVIVVVVLNIITAFLIDDFTVMRAQIADDAEGVEPEWMSRVRTMAKRVSGNKIEWEITRPLHTINVLESMFSDDIEAMFEEEGLVAPQDDDLRARVSSASAMGAAMMPGGGVGVGGGAGEVKAAGDSPDLYSRLERWDSNTGRLLEATSSVVAGFGGHARRDSRRASSHSSAAGDLIVSSAPRSLPSSGSGSGGNAHWGVFDATPAGRHTAALAHRRAAGKSHQRRSLTREDSDNGMRHRSSTAESSGGGRAQIRPTRRSRGSMDLSAPLLDGEDDVAGRME